jgi:hypothetical protein
MRSDSTHVLHRIDVKDQLPREDSYVLVWGHNKEDGLRWMDVFLFDGVRFVDDGSEDPEEHSDMITHWADMTNLNWNDGVPFNRMFNQ